MRLWLGGLAALSLAACSLDYGTEGKPSPEQIPTVVMRDFQQTTVQEGRSLYQVQGQTMEDYPGLKQRRLKQFTFQEYDSQGNLGSQGQIEAAVVDTETNNATLSGAMAVRSFRRNFALQASDLTWNHQDRQLKTTGNHPVAVQKDDGSFIHAQGLTLDLRTNTLELIGGIQGQWSVEKNDVPTPSPRPPAPAGR